MRTVVGYSLERYKMTFFDVHVERKLVSPSLGHLFLKDMAATMFEFKNVYPVENEKSIYLLKAKFTDPILAQIENAKLKNAKRNNNASDEKITEEGAFAMNKNIAGSQTYDALRFSVYRMENGHFDFKVFMLEFTLVVCVVESDQRLLFQGKNAPYGFINNWFAQKFIDWRINALNDRDVNHKNDMDYELKKRTLL